MTAHNGAMDVYSLPAVTRGRETLEKYRSKIEAGVGKAQVLAEIGGASYLAARLSAHLGGPGGKMLGPLPLELAIGAACGALAMSGSAGKHAEDLLAVGVGAIAAYTSRLGFEAGLATAKPPADPAGQVAGVAPVYYYLPAPPQPMTALPPPRAARAPLSPQCAEPVPPSVVYSEEPEIGAGGDEIDVAAAVLDQIR